MGGTIPWSHSLLLINFGDYWLTTDAPNWTKIAHCGVGGGEHERQQNQKKGKKLFRFSSFFAISLFSSMWYKRWVKGGIFPSELWPLGVAPLSSSYLKQQEEDLDCGCKIVLMLWPCLNLSVPELSQTRPGFNPTYKKS